MGYKANNLIEKSMSAKTETSVERREARTTEAETAAFMERTEESLKLGNQYEWRGKRKQITLRVHFGVGLQYSQQAEHSRRTRPRPKPRSSLKMWQPSKCARLATGT